MAFDLDIAEVRIRVRVDAAQAILDDGRVKNQHETMGSGGLLDPEFRRSWEERAFAYPLDADAEERPVFGYLASAEAGTEGEGVNQYGVVTLVLKKGVRERTTFTVGDSLSAVAVPSPVLRPHWTSIAYYDVDMLLRARRIDDWDFRYTEAQIHGGVALDDIEEIVVPPSFVDHPLTEQAAALGISLRVLP